MNSAFKLAVSLAAGVGLAGCVHYREQPLEPAKAATAWESRRLDAPELRVELERARGTAFDPWPPSQWDFPTLTGAAVHFHPSLELARAQWRVSQAAVITAGGRPNPTLSVVPEYNFSAAKGATPWLPAVNVDLPIETAGKRGHRVAHAEQLAEAARLNVVATAWQLRGRLRTNLVELITAQRHEALLGRQAEAQSAVVALLEQRLAAGAVAAADLFPARVLLSKTQLEHADARRRAEEACAAVAESLGLPAAALTDVKIVFELGFDATSVERLTDATARQRALQTRADLLGTLAEYAASQSALQLEIAKQYPDVHLGTGYQWDQGDSKWSLGLTAEIPVLNRNQGPIAEAQARRAEVAARFTAAQAGVLAEIDRAVAAWRGAREQIQTAEDLAATARRQAAAVQGQFAAGAADRLDLATAQVELTTAERTVVDAQSRAQLALGAIESAVQATADDSFTFLSQR